MDGQKDIVLPGVEQQSFSYFLKTLCYSVATAERLNKVRGHIKEVKSPGMGYHVRPRLDEKSLLSLLPVGLVPFILHTLTGSSLLKRL